MPICIICGEKYEYLVHGVPSKEQNNAHPICGNCMRRDGRTKGSTSQPDMVNHPPHYTRGGIEVADFIEAYKLNWQRGNAVKYIVRAGEKDPSKEVEDIRKAIWFLNRDLARMEREAQRN